MSKLEVVLLTGFGDIDGPKLLKDKNGNTLDRASEVLSIIHKYINSHLKILEREDIRSSLLGVEQEIYKEILENNYSDVSVERFLYYCDMAKSIVEGVREGHYEY